jgi:hypothetical protein
MHAQVTVSAKFPDDKLTEPSMDRPVDVSRVVARLVTSEVVELEAEAARPHGPRSGLMRRSRGAHSAERQTIEHENFLGGEHNQYL